MRQIIPERSLIKARHGIWENLRCHSHVCGVPAIQEQIRNDAGSRLFATPRVTARAVSGSLRVWSAILKEWPVHYRLGNLIPALLLS
jgi:hypothetical protein